MNNLNELAKQINESNYHWWHDLETGEPLKRNKGELLMLVVSELVECMEGERKDLMDDHLPHREMAEVELADAKIRLLDYAGGFGIPLYTREQFMPKAMQTPENRGEGLLNIVAFVLKIQNRSSYFSDITISETIAYIEAYALKFGYDLEGAMLEKLEYNKRRADHKPENRKAEGGKKW